MYIINHVTVCKEEIPHIILYYFHTACFFNIFKYLLLRGILGNMLALSKGNLGPLVKHISQYNCIILI